MKVEIDIYFSGLYPELLLLLFFWGGGEGASEKAQSPESEPESEEEELSLHAIMIQCLVNQSH